MSRIRWTLAVAFLAALLTSGGPAVRAQASPQIPLSNADCTASDALGRRLPSYAEVGPPKPSRRVGLFYWQWHGDDRWGPDYDVTKFLKTHPGFQDFQAHPKVGPGNPTWYWAEPLFGYYRSTDAWVIRKHLVLLADAGVDFLFLDYTNGSTYDKELTVFLDVARDLKSHGLAVPRLVFFLNYEPDWKAEALYETWYKPGRYDDLWFRWQGKPLMMSPRPTDGARFKDPSRLKEVQDAFTWRPTWAFQDGAKEPTKWRFMDDLKDGGRQHPALGPDGKPEQIVVNKSLGGPLWDNMQTGSVSATPGHVPTYDDQWLSGDQGKGLFFQASWDNALKSPAPILLVTGWNEWTASVWETPGVVFLGRTTGPGQGHIVDEFNQDFNRDLEPMQGGTMDNYYWQFVANMRRYKGMTPPQAPSGPQTISLPGTLAQWDSIRPIYRDAQGDTADRDADAAVPNLHYTNKSARNDLVLAQVTRDASRVYFHVRTASPLSPPAGKNWMMLLVDADQNAGTGWNGYDFRVNRLRRGAACSVEKWAGGRWVVVASAPLSYAGRDLVLSLPRRLLGQGAKNGPVRLDFKWVDNLPDNATALDFYSAGDAAPDARFNYRYEAR